MQVIKIGPVSHDLKELCKLGAAFRTAGFVRRQIAGNDVRETRRGEWTKIPSTSKIGCRINYLRLSKVRIPSRSEFRCRAGAVATVAVSLYFYKSSLLHLSTPSANLTSNSARSIHPPNKLSRRGGSLLKFAERIFAQLRNMSFLDCEITAA